MGMNTRSTLLCLTTACALAGCAASPDDPSAEDTQARFVDEAERPLKAGSIVALWLGELDFSGEVGCATAPLHAEVVGEIADDGVATLAFAAQPPEGVAGGWTLSPIGLFVWAESSAVALGGESGLTAQDVSTLTEELAVASIGFVLATDGATEDVDGPLTAASDLAFPGASYTAMSDGTLLHLPRGSADGTLLARLFGAPLRPGYHLVQWSMEDDEAHAEEASTCLANAADQDARFACSATRFRQAFTLAHVDELVDVRMGQVDSDALGPAAAGDAACD
jgi:hypothetical protein